MQPKTRRAGARFAAIFAGVFATTGALAQDQPEVPAEAAESAPEPAPPVAPAASPPAAPAPSPAVAPAPSPQVAPSPPVAPAPAVQAAPSPQVAPAPSPQVVPAASVQVAVSAPAPVLVGPPPPPAWEQSKPKPAPVEKQRAEYDGPPLVFGRRPAIGGYAGFTAAYTRMFNSEGALLGFEGALLIAHRLSLGAAGFGFTRSPEGPSAFDGAPRNYAAGYGGFVGRYAIFVSSPVYASLGVLIGGGATSLHPEWQTYEEDEDVDYDGQADGFFVLQPELNLHANVTRWMRFGFVLGYRMTSGVERFGLTESDMNGVVVGGNVQFGWI
jgi:hypothetical protein